MNCVSILQSELQREKKKQTCKIFVLQEKLIWLQNTFELYLKWCLNGLSKNVTLKYSRV